MIELKKFIWRYTAAPSRVPIWETVWYNIDWGTVHCPKCRGLLGSNFFKDSLFDNDDHYFYNRHKCKGVEENEWPLLRAYKC